VAVSAMATTSSALLFFDRTVQKFTRVNTGHELTPVLSGKPQTILIAGSDRRHGDKKLGLKPRSDTIMLMRVDPGKGVALMSLPRDLKVDIPGHGSDKINVAYEIGGPKLTIKTVKQLTGLAVNHYVDVSFRGFGQGVDALGCVYVDVDRRYFNDNSGLDHYATIDIQPGYQKLTGQDALDYVRFRHTDNDIVRAARQQDFLRQARNTAGFKRLLAVGDRDKLARVFARYFQFDQSFTKTKEIFSLLRLGLFLAQHAPSVSEVRFPYYDAPDPALDTRLYFHPDELRAAVNRFMNAKPPSSPSGKPTVSKPRRSKSKHAAAGPVKGLMDARTSGEDQAVIAQPKIKKFDVYFPTQLYQGSTYSGTAPRVYTIRDETGKRHKAYRLVVSKGVVGEYYGVEGMSWKDPPLLDNPNAVRIVNGRRLLIYRDGSAVRIVAWKTKKAVYWISNTLTKSLSPAQMIGIASSMKALKH
jgi:LCP family protein required for cell wall assembly